MRKILIIFCFVATSSYSQTLKWVNLISFQYENSTCHQGDSATVVIKHNNNMVEQDTLKIGIQHIYPDNTVSSAVVIYKVGFIPEIHNLPVDANGNKTIKVKIPDNFQLGSSRILVTSNPTTALNRPVFTIDPKIVSGIVDYFDESSTILYFDILGNKVKTPSSGVFIWIDNKGKSGKVFIE